ncbi:MAG: molecular chaperone HtpG, partial [Alphaproteobacteria bacterium]|nr:molecular chaperone HtpG [Alphaproteobacteria bacterium]
VSKVEPTEKLTNSPVSLTVENGQMSIHLERLMRNHQQQTTFASSRILEINPYHPLIIKLAESVNDKEQKQTVEEVCRLLLDQAKIAEGEAINDSSFFSEKLSDYILRGWQKSA